MCNNQSPPEVSNPIDKIIYDGLYGNYIEWIALDQNPWTYNVTVNGTIFISDTTWVNGSVFVILDSLEVGFYEVMIQFQDVAGNTMPDIVYVTVIDSTPPVIFEMPEDPSISLKVLHRRILSG